MPEADRQLTSFEGETRLPESWPLACHRQPAIDRTSASSSKDNEPMNVDLDPTVQSGSGNAPDNEEHPSGGNAPAGDEDPPAPPGNDVPLSTRNAGSEDPPDPSKYRLSPTSKKNPEPEELRSGWEI